MTYSLFKERIELKRRALVLPDDCAAQEPEFYPTPNPTRPRSWTFKWVLRFTDNHYIRIQEHHQVPTSRPSRRQAFAMHYGPVTKQSPAGIISYENDDPVIIRIDTSPHPPHLHVNQQNPHIGQECVVGIQLATINMFDFIQAVFKHRQNRIPIEEAFGFRIIEKS